MNNFTVKQIDSLPILSKGKRSIYYNIDIKGLALRLTSTGTKTFYMYLLILLAILGLLKRSLLKLGIVGLLFSTGHINAAYSDDWYLGAGYVMSSLKPITIGTNFHVKNSNNSGITILVGKKITSQISMELSYSTLGDVALQSDTTYEIGTIKYYETTLGSLFYLYSNDVNYHYFYTIGARYTSINASDNLIYRIGDEANYYLGFGFDLNNQLRLSYQSYSKDVTSANLIFLF
jgi:hypothetical protein